ncbi:MULTISPECIES: TetR/AcrR family transcriptional regulator [Fictibacillus]|jgi:AcrR family transcriptional regulator|uniref:TetR/AcrR family transcriptional regulator n=1 Tax=Fictibacillus TaxID=1329200 RepID=UPI0010295CA1|nr:MULTISPECIES: TetR/AcrR family transcriptional regulator [Fictibacillus]RZT14528.1 TetR family transcriptional regulator [Fictibacillus sp. BK138]
MPKVSAQYKEEKRNHILESALKCFGEKGYQATIIDDIVKDSNISKGAIYNYFESKEEIYLQLLKKRTNTFFEEMDEVNAQLTSAKEKLANLFKRFKKQELKEDDQQTMRVYIEFWLYGSRQEDLRKILAERYNRFIDYIVNIIVEGQNSGEIKKEIDPQNISRIFWAIRDGNVLHYSFLGEEEQYRIAWDTIEEMFLNYVQQ